MIVKPGRESSIRMNVDIFNQVAENRNYMCIHIKQFTLSQSNNLHLVNGICSICSIVWVAHFLQFFFFNHINICPLWLLPYEWLIDYVGSLCHLKKERKNCHCVTLPFYFTFRKKYIIKKFIFRKNIVDSREGERKYDRVMKFYFFQVFDALSCFSTMLCVLFPFFDKQNTFI